MFSDNGKISNRQLQALLMLYGFGMFVLPLPRYLAEVAGQNGWQLLFGGTGVILVFIFLVHQSCRQMQDTDFIGLCKSRLGSFLTALLGLFLLLKILFTTGALLSLFGDMVKRTLLPTTPLWIITGAMILVSLYLDAKGYEARGRLAEILVFITFLPLLLMLAVACFGMDFTRLLPLEPIPMETFWKGSVQTAFTFQGLELLLLAYPALSSREKSAGSVVRAVLLLAVLVLAVCLLTLACFGPEAILGKEWPVLSMLEGVELPGAFIDRQDAILLWFWILTAFSGISSGIFFFSYLAKQMDLGMKNWSGPLSGCLVFAIGFILKDADAVLHICGWAGGIYVLVVSLLLLLTRGRGAP